MSNGAVGVPAGLSDGVGSVAGTARPIVVPKTTPAPSAPVITSVSDLSKRPIPPQLDSALARFYPASLRNQGIEGEALIRVVLGKDGRVSETHAVSESHPGFAPACEKALRTSRWDPPIDKHGNPTRTALKYRCRFRVHL
jgi:outer membrane biosynthesis protein TonB